MNQVFGQRGESRSHDIEASGGFAVDSCVGEQPLIADFHQTRVFKSALKRGIGAGFEFGNRFGRHGEIEAVFAGRPAECGDAPVVLRGGLAAEVDAAAEHVNFAVLDGCRRIENGVFCAGIRVRTEDRVALVFFEAGDPFKRFRKQRSHGELHR